MQLPLLVEQAVAEQQWNLVTTFRQLQGILNLVTDQERAEQAGILVEPFDAHGVIVVPQSGRILAIGVMKQR